MCGPTDCMTDAQRTALLLPHGHRPGVVLCHPTAAAGLPDDPEFIAAALLLRECMHHLGFAALA